VLEKAAVDADVARLSRLERAHHDDQHRLRRTLDAATHRADNAEQRAAALEAVVGRVVDTSGDRFSMTIDGSTHSKRVDAGDHLQRLLRERLDQTPPETSGPTIQIGTLGGLAVHAQGVTTIEDEVRVTIPDAHIDVRFLTDDLRRSDPSNLITRLERHLHRLPDTIADLHHEAETARTEAQRAEARVGAPWDRSEELAGLRWRQQEIDEQLAASTEPPQNDQLVAASTEPSADLRPPSAVQVPSATPGTLAEDQAAQPRMTQRLDAIEHRASLDHPGVSL
jgi:hypothetical protein